MIKVVYLPTFQDELAEPNRICEGIGLPHGYVTTVKHKFIVFSGAEELVLVIGPIYGRYQHEHIADNKSMPQLPIAGGGYVTFTGTRGDRVMDWQAKFDGSSGDYGVFTTTILSEECRKKVADALMMRVEFEWKGTSSPLKSR